MADNVFLRTQDVINEHKALFEVDLLSKISNSIGKNHSIVNKENYELIITEIENSDGFTSTEKKEKGLYYKIKNFTVVEIAKNTKVLMTKDNLKKARNRNHEIDLSKICRVAYFEEIFDIIERFHNSDTGHSAVRNTSFHLLQHYSNISREVIMTYISYCTCSLNRRVLRKHQHITPILTETFNSRGQVDLIDMQPYPDGDFKWIMHYQDHLTKFSYLSALKTKVFHFFNLTIINYHYLTHQFYLIGGSTCCLGTVSNFCNSRCSHDTTIR